MIIFAIAACLAFVSANGSLQCALPEADVPQEWIDMVNPCTKAMKDQVQAELNAAMQYMAMGAHFSKDSVNRPGFAKMFFESASEERDHAIQLISYLLMRGELTKDVSTLIKKNIVPETLSWPNAVSALKQALKLEAKVTGLIRGVIKQCESSLDEKTSTDYNDYHLVDYLTGVFLEEQYKGQRELAGKISTLDKMMQKHGPLGEWLYDKKLMG